MVKLSDNYYLDEESGKFYATPLTDGSPIDWLTKTELEIFRLLLNAPFMRLQTEDLCKKLNCTSEELKPHCSNLTGKIRAFHDGTPFYGVDGGKRSKVYSLYLPHEYMAEKQEIEKIDYSSPEQRHGCEIHGLPGLNAAFVGRSELLDRIEDAFASGCRIQILSGMAGVGKTQIAKQYAYDNLEEYDLVYWLNAESAKSLNNSCAFMGNEQQTGQAGDDFCRYLNNIRGKYLIVYDNAEIATPDQVRLLDSYIPKNGINGHILITTRHQKDFHGVRPQRIDVFTMGEARLFIQKSLTGVDAIKADMLAKRLSCHPLALSYAISCIHDTAGYTIDEYLDDLSKTGIRILDAADDEHPDNYRDTVRAAFHVTLDKLLIPENGTENARLFCKGLEQLIHFLPYNPPDCINLDIMADFGVMLPTELKTLLQAPSQRHKLMRILTAYSLCHEDTGSQKGNGFTQSLSIHRLLQEIIADELGEYGFYGLAICSSAFWYIDGYAECISNIEDILSDENRLLFDDTKWLRTYLKSNDVLIPPNAFTDEIIASMTSHPFSELSRKYHSIRWTLEEFRGHYGVISRTIRDAMRQASIGDKCQEDDIKDFWLEVQGFKRFDAINRVLGHGYLNGIPTYHAEEDWT